MKRKLLLLPMFLLVLAACGPSTSSEPVSQDPTSEAPVTSEEPTTSEAPVTSEDPVTSDDDTLPPPPPTSEIPPAESMTIAQIRDIPLNASGGLDAGQIREVRTTGTVTNVARRAADLLYNVTIQDGEEAMLLYKIAEEDIADFGEPGDLLTVEGTLAPYEGLWELSGVKVISKEAGTAITPKALTSVAQDSLVGLDSVLVKIEGLSYVAGQVVADTNADNLSFKLGEDTIGAYLHYAIPEEVQAEIAAALVPTGDADGKIDVMDTLTFTGIVDMNKGTYQLAITGPENFSNVTDGGEPTAPTDYDSIIDIRAGIKDGTLKDGDVVNFEGVVTSKDNFSASHGNGEITLQSTDGTDTSGIFMYRVPTAQYDSVAVGNLIRGTATIDAFEGLDQLASPFSNEFTVVEAVGPTQAAVELTETLIADANFVDKTGTLVTATALTATADVNLTADDHKTVTLAKGAQTVDLYANKYFADYDDVIAKLNLIRTGYTVELQQGAAYLGWRTTERVMLLNADLIIVKDTEGNIVTETPVDPEPPVEDLELINSFNFLDGGDSGNSAYANVDITTNVSYATDNPDGTTGTTTWEADYSNLSLDYGTRLGGKLISEEKTDNSAWANIATKFTFASAIEKVEVRGAVYFGSNVLTGLYLQSSLDGLTWTTEQQLPVPAELTKSAAGNDGIVISFTDLAIPANSYIRLGVGLTASSSNSGLQFTGIAVFAPAAV